MKGHYLTYFFFMICMGTSFSQHQIKNVHVEIEYYGENETSFRFFEASEDLYQVNLFSGKQNDLDLSIKFRMEDELSSEERYAVVSEVAYFDLEFNHRLGPFGMTWAIENLLNFNSPGFDIEGSLERDSVVMDTVTFAHEADFMLSSRLTYNF
ncbi:hypothetical protein [Salinimicrobium flavum]|uniref:Porin n=1 Tax=Salinimicrobium flavum TaxID=1737065 RepID=A0ABW5IXI5_9FLAO